MRFYFSSKCIWKRMIWEYENMKCMGNEAKKMILYGKYHILDLQSKKLKSRNSGLNVKGLSGPVSVFATSGWSAWAVRSGRDSSQHHPPVASQPGTDLCSHATDIEFPQNNHYSGPTAIPAHNWAWLYSNPIKQDGSIRVTGDTVRGLEVWIEGYFLHHK